MLPCRGEGPIAVVPTIMETAMRETWVDNVVSWSCQQDAVGTLLSVLRGLVTDAHTVRVATPRNVESLFRMSRQQGVSWIDGSSIVHDMRVLKTGHEIAAMRRACRIAAGVLDSLPNISMQTEREVARSVCIEMLQDGADTAPFVLVRSGPDGYDVRRSTSDRTLVTGDVVVVGAGCTSRGLWCACKRNYVLGKPSLAASRANCVLWDATEAALAVVRPYTQTTGGLWQAMLDVLVANGGNPSDYAAARMGHGVGRACIELPSIARGDQTVLRPGMVLTLEPGLRLLNLNLSTTDDSVFMVHEECFVVTNGGYSLLTTRAPRDLAVLPCLVADAAP